MRDLVRRAVACGLRRRPRRRGGGRKLPENSALFPGTRAAAISNPNFITLKLLPDSRMQEQAAALPPRTIPRIPGGNQFEEWVRACKGGPAAGADFAYSARLTEMVLLSNPPSVPVAASSGTASAARLPTSHGERVPLQGVPSWVWRLSCPGPAAVAACQPSGATHRHERGMSLHGFEGPEEHGPVTWWRGLPVHAVHLLVAALVVSMLATTALQLARADGLISQLAFSGEAVWRGELWRLITYGLVNPPSLALAIELLMLVWFGREVERFLGRRDFLRLYAGLYLVRPLLFTALTPVLPANFAGGTGSFAVFIAFATLFPDAPLLFNLLARWVAWGLLALGALMALGARDGVRLLELAATCGFAFAFIRHHQGRWSWPRFPRFRLSRPATAMRAAPVPVAARAGAARGTATTPPVAAPMAEVDVLLDKIAQSGLHSLTAAERARLEAAREDLQRRRPKA